MERKKTQKLKKKKKHGHRFGTVLFTSTRQIPLL
jgi:hypothetical protein